MELYESATNSNERKMFPDREILQIYSKGNTDR